MEHRVSNCGKTAHILTLHNHQNASVILTLHFQQSCTLEFFFSQPQHKWLQQMSVPGTSAVPERIHFPMPNSCLLEEIKCKQVQQTPRRTPQWPHGRIHYCSNVTWKGWERAEGSGGGKGLLYLAWTITELKERKGKWLKRQVTPVSIYSVGKIRFPLL